MTGPAESQRLRRHDRPQRSGNHRAGSHRCLEHRARCLYPAPLLNVINPAVDWTMNTISAVDPEPVVSSDGSQP